MQALVGGTALASGVLGGALFAFSSLVMPALERLDATAGISAMQSVNEVAARSVFIVPLLASGAGSVAVAAHAALTGGEGQPLRIAGAGLGLVAFAVTVAANVPLNDALASIRPGDPGAAGEWAAYGVAWTRWNHVRALAALASATLLALSLRSTG